MAITTNQSILRGLNGKLGDVVTRTVNNKTVVSKTPKRRSKKSAREVTNHSLFQQAAAFAVEAMRDPGLKLHFKNVAKKRKLPNGYTAALSLKLKELNAAARALLAKESKSLAQELPGSDACVDNTKHFTQVCQDAGNILADALLNVSTVWRNINRSALEEKQKEVLVSTAREQIRQWLKFV